jgi:sarcosine oxidase gamma subunit
VDSHHDIDGIIEAAGLSISLERALSAASLRYLDRAGAYARAAEQVLKVRLPAVLEAVTVSSAAAGAECILAWRNPTETLLLSAHAADFAQMSAQLVDAADGCTVDQSGGLWAVRIRGGRIADLLMRLGSSATIPQLGEARTGRIAELAVLALCVRAEETLLVFDRVHAEHLLGWIGETARDL